MATIKEDAPESLTEHIGHAIGEITEAVKEKLSSMIRPKNPKPPRKRIPLAGVKANKLVATATPGQKDVFSAERVKRKIYK